MRKNKWSYRVILIFILLVLCGLPLILKLDIKLSPEANPSSLTVSFSWPYAEPITVEQKVTSILEAIAARVQGISRISSRSARGAGTITILLDKNKDADVARFELSTLIRQAWVTMPPDVSYPVITVYRPDDEEIRPLLSYTLSSPGSISEVQLYAELQMKPAMASVNGISRIEIYGALPKEWQVIYEPEKIMAVGLTPEIITKAIGTGLDRNELGVMRVSKDGITMPVVIQTGFSEARHMQQLPVGKTADRIIRLSDIADMERTEARNDILYRINGQNTINILVYAAKGENNLIAARNFKTVMRSLAEKLPAGYHLLLHNDSTQLIYYELKNIGIRSALAFVGLLIMSLIITHRLKYLVMIAVTLIGNISIAVIFYYILKLEIHLYALAGITVSFGLMTDNIIIMADHLRTRGNRRAFLAILAGTLTTTSSLMIIFFLGDQIRDKLEDFVMVVIINQTVSLFTALFVIPAIMDRMKLDRDSLNGRSHQGYRLKRNIIRLNSIYKSLIYSLRKHRNWALVFLIFLFGLPLYLLPESVDGNRGWQNVYNVTLGSSFYTKKLRPVADVITGGTLRLFTEKVFKGSYFGTPQETYLAIYADMPLGTTIERADATVTAMEKFLMQFRQIRFFRSTITPTDAVIEIYFTQEHQRTVFPAILKGDIISKAVEIGGAYWNVIGFGDPFTNMVQKGIGNYYVRMLGYNYDKLCDLADTLSVMLMQNTRVSEVVMMSEPSWRKPDNIEFKMAINRERAIISGLQVGSIATELSKRSFSQPRFAMMKTDSGNEDVKLKRALQEENYWAFARAPVASESAFYRVDEVTHVSREILSPVITRENQQYLMFLRFDFVGQEKSARLHINETLSAFSRHLPLGYSATPDSGLLSRIIQQEQTHYWLLGLIIVIIFSICAIIFDSLRQPLAVIMTIPTTYIGLFLTFWIFRLNFDQGGFAAMLILTGITVNAAIYILYEYNTMLRAEENRTINYSHSVKLYLKALNYKIVPVMLTIISTIIGFLPFVIGERMIFWFALAAGTIGGMLFSVISIFFCLPLFLKMPSDQKKIIHKN